MKLRLLVFIPIVALACTAGASAQVYSETTTHVVTGEVVRLEPGKTVVLRSGGEEIAYVLSAAAALPGEVLIGRSVSVQRASVTGEVVRIEPGRTIMVRSDGAETRYVLSPSLTLPAGVQVGHTATVLEPGPGGASLVKRVSTTTVGADGKVRETTEITRTDPRGRTSRSAVTTLTGRVEAYRPGQSVTVLDSNGARLTYVLGGESQIPAEVIVGKEVTLYVAPKDHDARVVYEIQRHGNTVKIKAKTQN